MMIRSPMRLSPKDPEERSPMKSASLGRSCHIVTEVGITTVLSNFYNKVTLRQAQGDVIGNALFAHTGLVVARFFADRLFALMHALSATSRYALVSTLVAQSEASVGQNDAPVGLGRAE